MPPDQSDEDRFSAARRGLISRLVPKSPSAALKPVAVPEPETRTGGAVISLIAYLSRLALTMAVVLSVFFGCGYYIYQQYIGPGPLPTDKVVLVKGGLSDVIEQLVQDGVIDKPLVMMAALYANGVSGKIKAGEYMFRQQASLEDVINTLVEGKSILQSLTVKEGLTSQQVVDLLRDSELLTGDITTVPAEGTILPETYKFSRGMSRQQLLDRMVQDQTRVVRELWARRIAGLPIQRPAEMIILASIVEKETGRADERSRVARVFMNRLEKRMRLQSDPTIVYGLVGGKGSLGRPLSKQDIESNTPFNTYVIAGLPPAPICNPGRAALEAVINPSRTNDLYFVSDGSGGHVFSDNYELHQRYVARLRVVEAERAAKEAASAPPPMARAPESAKSQQQAASSPTPQQNQAQPVAPAVRATEPAKASEAVKTSEAAKASEAAKTPEQIRLEADSKFEPSRPDPAKAETTNAEPAARPEPVTFVAPSVVPVPPIPPQGLREGAAAAPKPAANTQFDLSTSKVVPKLN